MEQPSFSELDMSGWSSKTDLSTVSQAMLTLKTEVTQVQSDPKKGPLITRYRDLDKLIGGLTRRELIVLTGETSFGKTALALNLAAYIADPNCTPHFPVLVYSLEVNELGLAQRFLSAQAGIDSFRLLNPKLNEKEAFRQHQAEEFVGKAPIFYSTQTPVKVEEIEMQSRQLKESRGLDLLIVDSLEAIEPHKGSPRLTIRLRNLAQELEIVVLALTNLVNRRNLLTSSKIARDADKVIFLYRDEKYDSNTDIRGVADIIVAKNRSGPTGRTQLLFLERTMKFLNLELEPPNWWTQGYFKEML